MKKRKAAKDVDDSFDRGEDVLDHFDIGTATRLNQSKRINLELPKWMLQQLDIEVARLGIPRQAVIKIIIDEKLKKVG